MQRWDDGNCNKKRNEIIWHIENLFLLTEIEIHSLWLKLSSLESVFRITNSTLASTL